MLPLLASRYDRSPDGLTYTFEIRDNARWHDGQPVTPDDVKFTYDYFRSQTLSTTLVAQPRDVTGAFVTGPRTVDIRIDRPVVNFLHDVASVLPIVPKHIWQSVADAAKSTGPETAVGCGPYKLGSYTAGEGTYLFLANDDYYLGKPYVKRVEMHPVSDDLAALQAGEIDVGSTDVFGVPSETLAPFRNDAKTFGIQETKTGIGVIFKWNVGKGGALGDVRFRQAMARGINRDDIVKRLTRGNSVPGSSGYLPPGNDWHVDTEPYAYDPAAANRLLDEAGYTRSGGGVRQGPDGKPLRYTLTVVSGIPAVLELVVGSLKGIGVDVTPKQVPLLQTLGSPDYATVIGFDGDITASAAPAHLRIVYSSKSGQFQHPLGYSNPTMDDLCDRQSVETDLAARHKIVADIQQLASKDLPCLPLYYPTEYSIYRRATFDQWGESNALTEFKRNMFTGLKAGVQVRPGI